jgi:hypothetical protein
MSKDIRRLKVLAGLLTEAEAEAERVADESRGTASSNKDVGKYRSMGIEKGLRQQYKDLTGKNPDF